MKRGAEELMTPLTKPQANGTWRLKPKYEDNSNPISVNSCVSVGGGQMTVNAGVELALQLDIRKSNIAAIEIAIACEKILSCTV